MFVFVGHAIEISEKRTFQENQKTNKSVFAAKRGKYKHRACQAPSTTKRLRHINGKPQKKQTPKKEKPAKVKILQHQPNRKTNNMKKSEIR